MRQADKYNQIVGITNNDTIFVLEDIFHYDDGFQGATRYEMGTLTKETVDYQNEYDTVEDVYKPLWVEGVNAGSEERSLKEFIQDIIDDTEQQSDLYFPTDDPSFRNETDEALAKLTPEDQAKIEKEFGKKGQDFVDWDCHSCGRCGKIDKSYFKIVLNPDLLAKIEEVEGRA